MDTTRLPVNLATHRDPVTGEAWTSGSYQNLPCGCAVVGNGTSPHPLTVKLCAGHAAVEAPASVPGEEPDPGCSEAGNWYSGYFKGDGLCRIRNAPCPTACWKKACDSYKLGMESAQQSAEWARQRHEVQLGQFKVALVALTDPCPRRDVEYDTPCDGTVYAHGRTGEEERDSVCPQCNGTARVPKVAPPSPGDASFRDARPRCYITIREAVVEGRTVFVRCLRQQGHEGEHAPVRDAIPPKPVEISLDDAKAALALIEDMSRYVGSMALQDYRRFCEAPAALAKAIRAAGGTP